MVAALFASLGVSAAMPASAQEAGAADAPPAAMPLAPPDPATISLPNLAVALTALDAENFEKYFYFHRADTTFAQAWADINECDALSSGIAYTPAMANTDGLSQYYVAQYGMAGAIGGAIGGALGAAMSDLIHGSAERREIRRENMRNCMGFKGYQRYGLPKDVWEQFNFEEGNGRKEEDERNLALAQQALAASGPAPATEALGI